MLALAPWWRFQSLASITKRADEICCDHVRPVRRRSTEVSSVRTISVSAATVAVGLCLCARIVLCGMQQPAATDPPLDAVFLPTPQEVVTAMLRMAHVGPGDVVYDLGSGDGRIVIAAVKEFGAARGVGIDLDEARNREARENARRAGVSKRVTFVRQSLYDTDLRPATVVTLYMGALVNLKLRPALQAQLKPGSRVVSHVFDMGDWMPDETKQIDGRPVFLWTIK
jgi:precorrin-6B methylase 2